MNIRAVTGWKAAALTKGRDIAVARRPPTRLTRRQFVRTAAGTAVLGGALGSGLLEPGLAEARASFAPVPIPGGTPLLGGSCHVFVPNLVDPIDAEPITITNLNGFVGLAQISGMVTQTNTKTGKMQRLPFINSDMRFMQGVFRGADGGLHQGTFAFV